MNHRDLPDILKLRLENNLGRGQVDGDGQVESADKTALRIVSEKDYYTAFEDLLQHRNYGCDEPVAGSTNHQHASRLSEAENEELTTFHLRNCVSAWAFDHDAHAKYAYYPSNVFPLGSTMEHLFFMRQWIRNVNYRHVKRLYHRSDEFQNVLSTVPAALCPCNYLVVFNALDLVEYSLDAERKGTDDETNRDGCLQESNDHILCRITIENELMMRSDFFCKPRKESYPLFNLWFYDQFLGRSRHNDVVETCNNLSDLQTIQDFVNTDVFYRHQKYESRTRKRRALRKRPDQSVDLKDSSLSRNGRMKYRRLRQMTDVCSRLLFERKSNSTNVGSERRLLVRCEDFKSNLYSPTLKARSCKHAEESVTYEQRHCGDEIHTEIRTCKKCGAVRAISN